MFQNSVAVGVLKENKLIAGIVYNNQHDYADGKPLSVEMSIYTIDKSWCSRHTLRTLFQIPFIQYNLERVQTHCSSIDEGVIMFNKRLGFKIEGLHPKAWPLGGDSLSWGMLKSECKWINHG